jgi:N4-gp56 family major capsid protein
MSTITGSSLSGSIVEYYEKRLLTQPEFNNDLLKYGLKAQIPKGNSDIIHWTRVDRFGRAQTVTDGTDLSSERTPTISTVQGKLELYGDFVKITPYGDDLRIFSMIDKSYDEFILQASREANARLQNVMVAGDSTTGNSFPAATLQYSGLGDDGSFAQLVQGGQCKLTVLEIEKAAATIRKNQGKGRIRCITNAWGQEDLMQDTAFRELIRGSADLSVLKEADLPTWGGATLGWNDDPYREGLSGNGGVAGTYSSTGEIFTTWVFSEEAYGVVQLMGRGGLRPRFKTQDISIIGNLVTIGYFLPFKGGCLKSSWVVAIKHVGTRGTSIASFV